MPGRVTSSRLDASWLQTYLSPLRTFVCLTHCNREAGSEQIQPHLQRTQPQKDYPICRYSKRSQRPILPPQPVVPIKGPLMGSIGFITFSTVAKCSLGELDNNGVHPDYAGKGWATYMYRTVLNYFREQGLRFAFVETEII